MLEKAKEIVSRLREAGATEVLFVGGFVRDHLMGLPSKDIDIEVYGLTFDQIESALAPYHRVAVVGKAFSVLKVDNTFDVSIPRRDSKVGKGHKGFVVRSDPNMSPHEAGLRRDFTINSIAMTVDGNVLDDFGGCDDIRDKVLRATSRAFMEDPLRVLRAMQFAGRFDMVLCSETVEMCRRMQPQHDELPKDRIFEEWWKWATKSKVPSRGLDALYRTHWDLHYPMLKALAATEQDPEWHPEGNVWIHTLHVCDAAAEIADRERLLDEDRAVLLFAALCHDLGKATTTQRNAAGRWIAPNHAAAGVEPTLDLLDRIGAPGFLREQVPPLVHEHMAHLAIPQPNQRIIRRLALRLAPSNLKMWSHVVEADSSGRPPLPKWNPVSCWQQIALELDLAEASPKPLLLGRHLLAEGWQPGILLGAVLKQAFEAQLDGAFASVESGLAWIHNNLPDGPRQNSSD
jgi:tRNA nucleotidyltransferase (CCA-adding enzyme)